MNTQNELKETEVSINIKLAALWTSLMFIIIYLDYFHLYMPGQMDDILKGKVFVFDITQGFLVAALTTILVPTLMIFVSVALPAKSNRLTNIIVAIIVIPSMLFNLAGEAWPHMVIGASIEVVLLCLIIRYAWKWPRIAG